MTAAAMLLHKMMVFLGIGLRGTATVSAALAVSGLLPPPIGVPHCLQNFAPSLFFWPHSLQKKHDFPPIQFY